MTAALVAGLLAGYGIAIPVGPVATYLVLLTARTSWRTGTAAALGVATTDGLYALVAVLGGTAVSTALAPVLPGLRWVSVAALVLLALHTVRAATRSTDPVDAPAASPWRSYLGMVALTAVNPVTVVYVVALVVGLRAELGPAEVAVFAVAAFAASASWQLMLAAGGSLLGRLLTGPRGRSATAAVSGLVMLVLAVHVALS